MKTTIHQLENFDIDQLDMFEKTQFDHFIQFVDKAEALQFLIDNVEGDYSQLSDSLREIAEDGE